MDNPYIEAFISRQRQECLNASWFLSVADARAWIKEWRFDDNKNPPYSLVGNLTQGDISTQLNEARKVV